MILRSNLGGDKPYRLVDAQGRDIAGMVFEAVRRDGCGIPSFKSDGEWWSLQGGKFVPPLYPVSC